MRISGTEPSSVILSQRKLFLKKVKNVCPKVPKQGKAKRDGVLNPQNYNLNEFLTLKIWCSQNATNQPKSTVELGYMCPRGLIGLKLFSDSSLILKIWHWMKVMAQSLVVDNTSVNFLRNLI